MLSEVPLGIVSLNFGNFPSTIYLFGKAPMQSVGFCGVCLIKSFNALFFFEAKIYASGLEKSMPSTRGG